MDFYQALAKYYDEIFPLKEVQLAFLQDYLERESLTSVLDIGCGTGSYAIELNFRGVEVLGLDLSKEMIEISRQKAREKRSSAAFAVEDMRDLSGIQDQFDGIVCLGNTLAHVFGECELKQVFSQFREKGRRLLLQIVNYDKILLQNIQELAVIKTDNLIFHRYYTHRPDRRIDFSMEIELLNSNDRVTAVNLLFPLKYEVLKSALLDTGWEITASWGGFSNEPWTKDSSATIIEAARLPK